MYGPNLSAQERTQCWHVDGSSCLQMSFFSIVGIPLFKSMTDIFEETRPMLQGVMENYKMWEHDAAASGTPAGSPRPHA